jgi:hypothetical protein
MSFATNEPQSLSGWRASLIFDRHSKEVGGVYVFPPFCSSSSEGCRSSFVIYSESFRERGGGQA